ncbi:MAG: phosphoenolpyruvate--protein phosphotransferase [Ruminococcus sp.]|nr:phosphoenolpyruvate--protein phosphotransferase [Ruminococcus sp.]
MLILSGKPVFGGIAKGKLFYFQQDENEVTKRIIKDTEYELQRYEYAKKQAIAELDELYETALSKVGENEASIFIIHKMLIEDSAFRGSINDRIMVDHFCADYAVAQTARDLTQTFSDLGSTYIKERAADLKDVCDRLIRHIQNKDEKRITLTEKVILCADELYPSETMQIDLSMVLAIVTRYGSSNSHTAILARTLGIPAIIGIGAEKLSMLRDMEAIVDGYNGNVYIEPDEAALKRLDQLAENEAKKREMLKRFKGRKNVTLDGTEIEVFANIAGLNDLNYALENDAGGVGLFRSEFLYLGRTQMPEEDEQFYNYRQVLERMGGRKVIIRTMDAGADKNIKYFGLAKEENPALGVRSIRLCLLRPEMFKTQLRALLRASVYGNLAIMLPLITTADEIHRAKKLIEEAKDQLRAKGQAFAENIQVGIMVETPAAVIMSDEFAQESDFFSIGTNDLEQYIMAHDRQNLALESYYEGRDHEPLLRAMRYVCENAHRHGIPVGICGELGADLELTEEFLKMGIDEISVTASQVLPLRQRIRTIKLDERKQLFDPAALKA